MPTKQSADIWTEELIADLLRLWAKGTSARDIAAILSGKIGREVTRNAILGKKHRLGLAGVDVKQRAPSVERKPRKRAVEATNAEPTPAPSPAPTPFRRAPMAMPTYEADLSDDAYRVPYMQLGRNHCRFIAEATDGINTVSCCRPTVGNTSWCAKHLEIVSAPMVRIQTRIRAA